MLACSEYHDMSIKYMLVLNPKSRCVFGYSLCSEICINIFKKLKMLLQFVHARHRGAISPYCEPISKRLNYCGYIVALKLVLACDLHSEELRYLNEEE